MNDGMYNNLRNYAEEQSSLLRQVLEEQKRTNEILSQLAAPVTQEQLMGMVTDALGHASEQASVSLKGGTLLAQSTRPVLSTDAKPKAIRKAK